MAVDLGGIKMRNPINTASGTFGFGWQFENLMNVSSLGAITCKGCATPYAIKVFSKKFQALCFYF